MMQEITWAAIEAAKAAIITIRVALNPVNAAWPVHVIPRIGSPVPKQPTFDWKAADKYQELWNLEIEENKNSHD